MPLLAVVIAFIVGGIPFGYLLVRLKTGRDVRSMGSGNIGATNVLRTTGRAIAIVTLLLDIGKGFFAVWLAGRLAADSPFWMSAAALAVILGHAFPVFLNFHGGKAVASFIGAFLYLAPIAMLSILVIFVMVVAATRHISLGSIIAAGTFPLAVWIIQHPPEPILITALVAGAFIVYRHRANIARVRAGSEHVFTFGSRK